MLNYLNQIRTTLNSESKLPGNQQTDSSVEQPRINLTRTSKSTSEQSEASLLDNRGHSWYNLLENKKVESPDLIDTGDSPDGQTRPTISPSASTTSVSQDIIGSSTEQGQQGQQKTARTARTTRTARTNMRPNNISAVSQDQYINRTRTIRTYSTFFKCWR